jgi:enoyl-CoA hydratase
VSGAGLLVQRMDQVAIITIDRPAKLNALNLEVLQSLDAVCDDVDRDHNLRAAVICGSGPAFSAGGDISAWSEMTRETFAYHWIRYGNRVLSKLAELRVPVIAAINGHALGGGLELAACADIRIAHPNAKIGLPEAAMGMIPGWSGTQRVAERFGQQIVRRMVIGGELFEGPEALRLGIVDQLAVDTLQAAMEYARRVAGRGPLAVQTAKLMIARGSKDGRSAATDALASLLTSDTAEVKEGVSAFFAKRQARFEGER